MNDNSIAILKTIYQAVENVLNATNSLVDANEFINNKWAYDITIMNLVVIEEYIQKMPESFKTKEDSIEWEKVNEYKSILVSDYYQLDSALIFKIIKQELPEFKQKLSEIIKY